MAGHNFVLYPFVVVLQALLSILALEGIKVADCELFFLGPPELQPFSLSNVLLLDFRGVKQIVYFFVINLQKRALDRNVLHLLFIFDLFENLLDCSDRNSLVLRPELGRDFDISSSLILLLLSILVAFHRVCLSRTSLAVSEYSRMESINYFGYQPWNLKGGEHFFLCIIVIQYLVELEVLLLGLVRLDYGNPTRTAVDFYQI